MVAVAMEKLRCDLTKVFTREQRWQMGRQAVDGVVHGAATTGGLVHAIGLASNGEKEE